MQQLTAYLLHFTALKEGKYSGLTNAEICRKYRETMSPAKKEKERLRKQKWREGLKKNKEGYNKYLESERMRKQYAKVTSTLSKSAPSTPLSTESESQPKSTPITPSSAFSTKQARNRSLKKADEHLPQSPRKKVEIIQNLASKYQMRVKLYENRGRPRKDLCEKKKEWMLEFLGRSDITYTNPGRKDSVYVGKINGERKYLSRQYLLWTLRDLLDIVNGSSESLQNSQSFVSTFSEKLTFSQLYDFIKGHKQFIYNKNIPHSSCFVTYVKM